MERHFILETLIEAFIEISGALDYFSDILIFVLFASTNNVGYATFMLLSTLCPYFTMYTCLNTFRLNKVSQKKDMNKNGKLTCC